jgi:hypothetical protein
MAAYGLCLHRRMRHRGRGTDNAWTTAIDSGDGSESRRPPVVMVLLCRRFIMSRVFREKNH